MRLVTGNILKRMVDNKIFLLPLNFILANVYAEREARKMATTVDKPDTTRLLINDLPKYWTPAGTFPAYAPAGLSIQKSLR